jgi:hypothetical protein
MIVDLTSLRVFAFQYTIENWEDAISFIMKASDRAPHLEYLANLDAAKYWKRVGGEWIICDEAEFLSFE